MTKDKIFHVISNTHWDREWRFPFQKNRQMLVEMIDKVLEILNAEPEYRAFHLDSQSVVIQDYLEIRPEKKDLIKKYVKEKRLLIGPWFILPDEFQVGGENLIRNLLLGHKISREYGGVSKTGYSPFSWGQISQLPQIYAGFGIDVIMFYRGVNSLDSKKAEFIWEGADGTKALTSRFSTMPRYNFYFYIYRPVIHNEGFGDVEYKWKNGGTPFHFADKELYGEDYYIPKPKDTYFLENIIPSVKSIIENQVNDFTTPHVIWMEGHDSSGPNIKTVRILRDIKRLLPEIEVKHSTLEEYTECLKKSADYKSLAIVKGERRSAQYDNRSGNLYGYTTSARMYLKQKNFETEKWLQYYAEPFNSIAGLLGLNIKDQYLEKAWYYLLENSAHDSIGGCSLDEIHDDMMFRYKQSIEISKGVFERACKYIAVNLNLSAYPENSIHIVLLNPTNYIRNEIVEAYIDIPSDMNKNTIDIYVGNKKVDIQYCSKMKSQPVVEQMTDRPMYFDMQRYHCYLKLNNVPSFGIKSLYIKPSSNIISNKKDKICYKEKGLPVLENKFLRVKIQSNGTLNVYDKLNKRSFTELGYFYDEGEAGHAWVNKPVKPFITTLKAKPEITVKENGHLSASCLIKYNLRIPSSLEDRGKRKRTEEIHIEVEVRLTQTARRIDFKIRLKNTAESHRLRIMFPTGLEAVSSFGEGQFDVVERSCMRPDTKDWIEQPMYDYPMHHFVDVNDGVYGAAVLVHGLKEYELSDDPQRTLAITLLRAFRFIIQPSSVQDYSHLKGSQCLGDHFYSISFYPHKGDWVKGKVYAEALVFNNDLRLFQTGRVDGNLNPGTSFFNIEPKELVFSCLKKSEDGEENTFVLRFYNPTDNDIQGTVNTHFNIMSAHQITLEENNITSLRTENNCIHIFCPKKKIISLKLKFANNSNK